MEDGYRSILSITFCMQISISKIEVITRSRRGHDPSVHCIESSAVAERGRLIVGYSAREVCCNASGSGVSEVDEIRAARDIDKLSVAIPILWLL